MWTDILDGSKDKKIIKDLVDEILINSSKALKRYISLNDYQEKKKVVKNFTLNSIKLINEAAKKVTGDIFDIIENDRDIQEKLNEQEKYFELQDPEEDKELNKIIDEIQRELQDIDIGF
jgi:hypothetical protein